jgi:hypothetical protein
MAVGGRLIYSDGSNGKTGKKGARYYFMPGHEICLACHLPDPVPCDRQGCPLRIIEGYELEGYEMDPLLEIFNHRRRQWWEEKRPGQYTTRHLVRMAELTAERKAIYAPENPRKDCMGIPSLSGGKFSRDQPPSGPPRRPTT